MDSQNNSKILFTTAEGMVMNSHPLELQVDVNDKFDIWLEVERVMAEVSESPVSKKSVDKGFARLLGLLTSVN